jgi:hypothetical protein
MNNALRSPFPVPWNYHASDCFPAGMIPHPPLYLGVFFFPPIFIFRQFKLQFEHRASSLLGKWSTTWSCLHPFLLQLFFR